MVAPQNNSNSNKDLKHDRSSSSTSSSSSSRSSSMLEQGVKIYCLGFQGLCRVQGLGHLRAQTCMKNLVSFHRVSCRNLDHAMRDIGNGSHQIDKTLKPISPTPET